MKRLLFLVLLIPMMLSGAAIDFRNLNTNHFTTNGFRVSLRGFPTNQPATTAVTNIVSQALRLTNVLHVSEDGNDATGLRNSVISRFRTPWGAKTNALAGDTIVVWQGYYTNGVTNLFKNDVNWHFLHTTLDWTDQTTNGPGYGFFDDRASGAITSRISGALTMKFCSGTNGYFDGSCVPFFGNANALGAIVLTNANSEVIWSADTRAYVYGAGAGPYALYIKNCKPSTFFQISEMDNGSPFAGNTFAVTNCPANPGDPVTVTVVANFLYWELGTFTCHFNRARASIPGGYGVNAYGIDTNDVGDMYLQGDYMHGKIYMVGYARAWKSWINISQLQSSNDIAYGAYGSGTHYLTAQKVSSDAQTAIFTTPNGGISNGFVHLTLQKVSSPTRWIDNSGGTIVGAIDVFEATSTNMVSGILNTGGNLDLSGRRAWAPRFVVEHRNGTTKLADYNLVATNNPAVFLSGIGLVLDSVSMNSPSNCITATNAQQMKLYSHSMANTNEHSNVTITMGSLSVNGGVQ